MPDSPNVEEVRAHLEHLFRQKYFSRGKTRRKLLEFLIDQWSIDGGIGLTEKSIGKYLGEPLIFEEDTRKYGCPKTRSNISALRKRLRLYYQKLGYDDPIKIVLDVGHYAPLIAYNQRARLKDVPPEQERLIFRAITAAETRSIFGATQAAKYYRQLDEGSPNPYVLANRAFIPYLIAPVIPYFNRNYAWQYHEDMIFDARATGHDPWECTFAEACIAASHYHDWPRALKLFESANARTQGNTKYYWWYPSLLSSMQRIPEAIQILADAVRHFAHSSLGYRTDLAQLQIMAGNYADADETLSGARDFVPEDNPALAYMYALFWEAQDRPNRSIMAIRSWGHKWLQNIPADEPPQKITMDNDKHFLIDSLLLMIVGRAKIKDADFHINRFVDTGVQSGALSHLQRAIALIGSDDRQEDAIHFLSMAAFEENEPMAMWFHNYPPLRHLRHHKAFRDLLKKLRLPKQ